MSDLFSGRYVNRVSRFFVFLKGGQNMDEPILKSPTTQKEYKISEVVRIVNPKQAALYIKNCIFPLHIYCDRYVNPNTSQEEPRLAFLFSRAETKWAYDLWQKGELR